jgi:general secretion pathway protein C
MHSFTSIFRLSYLGAFALAAVAAGSAVFWGLQLSEVTGASAHSAADQQPVLQVDSNAVARSLGAVTVADAGAASPVLAPGRFALMGVVAGQSKAGTALIAVDGKAAKPFVVGARVGDEWVLHSVQARQVTLMPRGSVAGADTGRALVLEMPAPGKPAK